MSSFSHGVSRRWAPVRRSTVQIVEPSKPSFQSFPPTVIGELSSNARVKASVRPSGEKTGIEAPSVPAIGRRPPPSEATVKSFQAGSSSSPTIARFADWERPTAL